MNSDPTAFDLKAQGGNPRNPFTLRITGVTMHGDIALDMPFITEVAPNLWQGGVETGLLLPDTFKHVVNVYARKSYDVKHSLRSNVVVSMNDSIDQTFEQVDLLAQWINLCRDSGRVLVHCRAGLNRSSLAVAKALLLSGEVSTGAEAVELMRAKRSPAVLCNPAFEKWVMEQ